FHGTGETQPTDYFLSWLIPTNDYIGNSLSANLIRQFSVKAKEKHSDIPQSDNYQVGRLNNYGDGGYSKDYYKYLGFQGSYTLEFCQYFKYKPNYKGFEPDIMRLGVEFQVNFLRHALFNYIQSYNQK